MIVEYRIDFNKIFSDITPDRFAVFLGLVPSYKRKLKKDLSDRGYKIRCADDWYDALITHGSSTPIKNMMAVTVFMLHLLNPSHTISYCRYDAYCLMTIQHPHATPKTVKHFAKEDIHAIAACIFVLTNDSNEDYITLHNFWEEAKTIQSPANKKPHRAQKRA